MCIINIYYLYEDKKHHYLLPSIYTIYSKYKLYMFFGAHNLFYTIQIDI